MIIPRYTGKGMLTMTGQGKGEMLWVVTILLLALCLLGFIGQVGGGFIHLLLLVALIVLIYYLVTRPRVRFGTRVPRRR
ncbi:MAG TPA: lmo0937 family membrane protein [Pyrinomonadaceae bacterium]